MPQWEYVTVVREGENMLNGDQLNKLGVKGYELVTIVPVSREETVVGRKEQRFTMHYFFKRPRAAE